MAVSLKPKFTKEQIVEIMKVRVERIEKAIILRLKRAGENFVKNARDNGTYNDRTGNLRSSIGYVVLKNGVQQSQNFRQVGKGKDGPPTARNVIDEVKGKFQQGYVLICVAGMDYAAAVESKGRDVITASSHLAEAELKEAIGQLARNIARTL